MNRITHRESLGTFLNECGLIGEIAEIGCAHGGFSTIVLSQWKGRKYYMIDPWEVQDSEIYRERQISKEDYDTKHRECCEIADKDKRAVVIRALSQDAVKQFSDGQLDVVYLDGNHEYQHVISDMDAWWPKVKVGGIMGGHDFQNHTQDGWWCEVAKAVMNWVAPRKLEFQVCPCSSWFIHKTSP